MPATISRTAPARLAALVLAGCATLAAAEVTVQAKVKPDSAWRPYQTRLVEHLAGFDTSTADGGRSQYGGILARRAQATGFFHAQQLDGRWWLVDPLGCLYLNVAVVSVTPGNSPPPRASLPQRFGTQAAWADSTSALLQRNGFNGTGAWSDDNLMNGAATRVPYTKIHNFMSEYGKIRGGTYAQPRHTGYPNDLIFVFDSQFVSFCDTRAQALAASRNDPYLIGYYSDNEMPTPRDALDRYLGLPATDQGYQAARAWFATRKGAAAGLANVTADDRAEFLRFFADTYYGIVGRAIRKYDPNHMYLGSRINFLELPYQFFQGAGPHLDAVSVNYYNAWTPQRRILGLISGNTGKPVLVTEWYVKGDDLGFRNLSGAGWIVPTQRERGWFYQHFALALLESRMCIGWQWFKYMDNDTLDTAAELSNIDANKGIVTTTFAPHTALLDEMEQLNSRVYALADYFDRALSAAPPVTARATSPLVQAVPALRVHLGGSALPASTFLLDGRHAAATRLRSGAAVVPCVTGGAPAAR